MGSLKGIALHVVKCVPFDAKRELEQLHLELELLC